MKIDFGSLAQKLEELILGQVGSELSNDARMDAVVAQAKAWLDKEIVFHGPFAAVGEAVTDALIQALPVRQIAQAVYDELSKAGRA